jgi:hypothetical protein
MTRGAVVLYNGATPFSVVLPARGGARVTATRESWRVAGRPIAHAAASGSEKTRLRIPGRGKTEGHSIYIKIKCWSRSLDNEICCGKCDGPAGAGGKLTNFHLQSCI